MSVAVSVIVPVYNADKYLEVCLNSIIRQSLENIEIIIVNDGSTDNSKSIIEKFTRIDKRIIYIQQPNSGVSAARNAGLRIASGKYVGFVDADDIVELNFYDCLFSMANDNSASIVVSNAYTLLEDGTKTERLLLVDEMIRIETQPKNILKEFLKFKYDYANWNKIYLLEIIKKNNLFFNEKISMWEDILFNLIFLKYSITLITTKKHLYNYRIHSTSVMKSNNSFISYEYNLFYQDYLEFCNLNNQTQSELLFKKMMSISCVSTMFILTKSRIGIPLNYYKFYIKFKGELVRLNPKIYLFNTTSKRTDFNGYILLYKGYYSIFSISYIILNELKIFNLKIRKLWKNKS